jgi:hypothetical protein
MCGIVGMISTEPFRKGEMDKRKFMTQALIIDTLRGEDSTGVFWMPKKEPKGEAGYVKSTDNGFQFVNTKEYQKLNTDMHDYWFMFGHNRASTVGNTSIPNAHPFQEGPITMIHNGTLRSTWMLTQSQKQLDVDVDSHALCHNLALHDVDDVESVLGVVDGAFALVWHDSRDQSLNICRNDERPIHIAQSFDSETLYVASEAAQLQYLNERLQLLLGDIWFPTPGMHMKFKPGSLAPEVNQIKLTPKFAPRAPYQGGQGWQRGPHGGTYANRTPKRSPAPIVAKDNRVKVGGRLRQIPQLSQEMLLKEEMLIEDRLEFVPMKVHPKPGSDATHAFVSGWLERLSMNAVLYHMDSATADAAFNRRWVIRPVAIRYTDAAHREPVVICRLVSTVSTPDLLTYNGDGPTEGMTEMGNEGWRRGGDEGEELFPGPTNHVPRQEFLELTAEGCCNCNKIISTNDAHDIEWLGEGQLLCMECSNYDIYGYENWNYID